MMANQKLPSYALFQYDSQLERNNQVLYSRLSFIGSNMMSSHSDGSNMIANQKGPSSTLLVVIFWPTKKNSQVLYLRLSFIGSNMMSCHSGGSNLITNQKLPSSTLSVFII